MFRRLVFSLALAAFTAPFSTAQAEPNAATAPGKPFYLSRGSYVAVGGESRGSLRTGDTDYVATGMDVRGLSSRGHGGFARFEQGNTGLFDGTFLSPEAHVLAFDVGYAFGGPLIGAWDAGVLGFFEIGMSGWYTGPEPLGEMTPLQRPEAGMNGLGVSIGAGIEAHLGDLRIGMALQRRDIPVMFADEGGWTSSLTLQVRLTASL